MLFDLLNHRNFTLSLPIGTDKKRYAPARVASLHKRNEAIFKALQTAVHTTHKPLLYNNLH